MHFLSVMLLLAGSLSSIPFAAQVTGVGVTPCIPHNGAQACSEASVREAVNAASSISVEAGPRDNVGTGQLRTFVAKLRKSVALDAQSADVSLKLTPVEQTGVMYGAADRELAHLEVFAAVGPARRQQLIWVEKLSGPADLSWPATVARILDQFRHRVAEH